MSQKYAILIKVLDGIRKESFGTKYKKYLPDHDDIEAVSQARSKAFIHLFLKVKFGLLSFEDREKWIVDGSYDGGIDAYYIDRDQKCIYFLQSKFRANARNFESKEIELSELLAMEVDRVLGGEPLDAAGNKFSGKILQLQREISEVSDVARYSYKVIVLANLRGVPAVALRRLTDGISAEIFDFEKSYKELLFPVLAGTYFTASDITIPVDLSNKSAGAKISYTVTTKASDCEITVLFVPAIEVAKMMSKYKNSILQFNPRSYLDFEGQHVNSAISDTILKKDTNEFALFNNGITVISDETNINERMGKKSQAQLLIKNPQIINGGQTSYTLSRIYDRLVAEGGDLGVFDGKEVLFKIITLIDNDNVEAKQKLIEEISNATNKQTPVINADRFANESIHKRIQSIVFDRYGMLYERKRGEFSDGVENEYIDEGMVIERNLLFRLYYAALGRLDLATRKKLFQNNYFPELNVDDPSSFDKLALAYQLHLQNLGLMKPNVRLREAYYAKIFAQAKWLEANGISTLRDEDLGPLETAWVEFLQSRSEVRPIYLRRAFDRKNERDSEFFVFGQYFLSGDFKDDVDNFHIPPWRPTE